ncbi:MAG: AAA family ATPase [Candidatus Pacebacteria bacterium]|nr:AAA family ATPase [Candidatus Paceibacterota bacterium]MCD8508401.1 AAA family ATPase [Candidatus Paceibacterota bacterium]MCD8563716.1 AAA family ATPase [Candidatus Paceibacterota bacterium]
MNQESALTLMKTGRNIFLTGAPGTGKTHTLNTYLAYLRDHHIVAAVTAPTGIAASHIGGVTIQSFFGTGIKDELTPWDIEMMSEKKYIWDRIKNLKVLVIDEVSMLSPALFESIDRLIRTLKFSQEPFGGIQVILVGDFFQLPPISRSSSAKRFIFDTTVWQELECIPCYLDTSYRHQDTNLLTVLQDIRTGSVSPASMNTLRSRYESTLTHDTPVTKLYTHNKDVDHLNLQELAKIDAPTIVHDAIIMGQQKWIDRILNNSLVAKRLELKKGALVFFIKNNYEKGYINGTLGTIIDFDHFGIPIVETRTGKKIKADREEWVVENEDGKPRATLKQIPLRLAWAITIHKSQGMTLDAAEIDLSQAFEPGQGYVALSRITSLEGLRLMGLNETALIVDPHVLARDVDIRNDAEIWQRTVTETPDHEHEKMHHEWIMRAGGRINKTPESSSPYPKMSTAKESTYDKTKALIRDQKSIEDMAHERGLTPGTILAHIEYIAEHDYEIDISYLQPSSKKLSQLRSARRMIQESNNPEDLGTQGTIRLSAYHRIVGNDMTYEEIRLGLLFI